MVEAVVDEALAAMVERVPAAQQDTALLYARRQIEMLINRIRMEKDIWGRQLPVACLVKVMVHLDAPSLLACRAVCRLWRSTADMPGLWRRKLMELTAPGEEMGHAGYDDRLGLGGAQPEWYAEYRALYQLEKRWQHHTGAVKVSPGLGSWLLCMRVVVDMDMDRGMDRDMGVQGQEVRPAHPGQKGREVLVVGTDAGEVGVVDAATLDTVAVLKAHSGRVNCLAVRPQHSSAGPCVLATGSRDNRVRLWKPMDANDANDGIRGVVEAHYLQREPLDCRGHTDWVVCLCLSEDQRTVFSGSDDSTLRQWDLETGECLQTFRGHTGLVQCLAVAWGDGLLLSGSTDTTVRVWDAATGDCLRVMHDHQAVVWALHFPECGGQQRHRKQFISGGGDGRVVIYKTTYQTNTNMTTSNNNNNNNNYNNNNNNNNSSSSSNHDHHDAVTPSCRSWHCFSVGSPVRAVFLRKRHAAAGLDNGEVHLWACPPEPAPHWDRAVHRTLLVHAGVARCLVLTDDAVFVGSHDNKLSCWSFGMGKVDRADGNGSHRVVTAAAAAASSSSSATGAAAETEAIPPASVGGGDALPPARKRQRQVMQTGPIMSD